MKLHAALLADAALSIPDGTLMIWRAGISDIAGVAFPAPASFSLVVRLEADAEEAAHLHEFRMRILHNDNVIVPWSPTPLVVKLPPGEPRAYINLVVNLRFLVPGTGEGFIESMIDRDVKLPLLYFRVRQMPALFGSSPPSNLG